MSIYNKNYFYLYQKISINEKSTGIFTKVNKCKRKSIDYADTSRYINSNTDITPPL